NIRAPCLRRAHRGVCRPEDPPGMPGLAINAAVVARKGGACGGEVLCRCSAASGWPRCKRLPVSCGVPCREGWRPGLIQKDEAFADQESVAGFELLPFGWLVRMALRFGLVLDDLAVDLVSQKIDGGVEVFIGCFAMDVLAAQAHGDFCRM